MNMPERDEAYALFCKYNETESLRKHALTVEGIMRHFATLYDGADPNEWGIIGLIHDIDYEKYPQEHCIKGAEILRDNGFDETAIRGMQSHGFGICTDVEPLSDMEKVLFTIDELSGLITATALMRPSRSVSDLKVKSVMKKWKTKSFAAGVDRELILQGAQRLNMSIQDVISECIIGMQKISDTIGL